jgi:hypothetical protein
MRILGGTKTSHEHLYNWMGSYTRHLDVDVRHELSIAYTTFGHLTSIGNVWIFAHAIHESDFFKKETFMRANNPAINSKHVFDTATAGVAAHFAHVLAYATLDDGLDDMTKTFIRLSPALSQIQKSGLRCSVQTWEDLAKVNFESVKQIVKTIGY